MADFIVQCQSVFYVGHCYGEELELQCRRERGHEGNHSANAYEDGTSVRSSEGPCVFRLDWRSNDGIVYTRYPKREDKRD